jgi:hypothetical protein
MITTTAKNLTIRMDDSARFGLTSQTRHVSFDANRCPRKTKASWTA